MIDSDGMIPFESDLFLSIHELARITGIVIENQPGGNDYVPMAIHGETNSPRNVN
jgi:hypothetical protein